jgi:hypothetical protein
MQLIVEELQQRLNNLDNHFFYKKSAFQVRNLQGRVRRPRICDHADTRSCNFACIAQTERHFENWRQREKADLERLINQLKQVPAFSATLNVKSTLLLSSFMFLNSSAVSRAQADLACSFHAWRQFWEARS